MAFTSFRFIVFLVLAAAAYFLTPKRCRCFRAALKYLTMFKEGMICTVSLSFLTVVFGFLLALVLALMRMSRIKPLSIFASIYVEVFRATPMLVQLFIIYYIVFGGVSLPS